MGRKDEKDDTLDEIIDIGPEAKALVDEIIEAGRSNSPGGSQYTKREVRRLVKATAALGFELLKALF